MTIRHTRERESYYRFGGPDSDIVFEPGEREITLDDETESWAVETYGDIEYVDDAESTIEEDVPEIESELEMENEE